MLVVLLAGCGYGASRGYDWWSVGQEPVASSSQPVVVKIGPGETPDEVSQDLKLKGLIRDKLVFDLYMRQTGARGRIQAGDFILNRNMSVADIATALEHGKIDQVAVTLTPGLTLKQMSQRAEQGGLGTAAEYQAAAADPAWVPQFDFLQSKPPGANLEGFLVPDSYSLNKGATAKDLVRRQLQQFAQIFPAELRAQAGQGTQVRPAESVFNIVVLASMVEREVNNDPDRALVCGVLYNRLKIGEKLGIDATVLYALGRTSGGLTQDDLNTSSPYNTRKFAGLPPGPISNPGAAAIRACVNPQASDFIFYFTDPKGVTHFDKTAADFARDQQKYGVAGT